MKDKRQALKEQGAKVGLKINATKTKLVHISTKRGNGVSTEEVLMRTSPIRARGTSCVFGGLDAMRGFAETSRAVTSRVWVNKKSFGLDGPHV